MVATVDKATYASVYTLCLRNIACKFSNNMQMRGKQIASTAMLEPSDAAINDLKYD